MLIPKANIFDYIKLALSLVPMQYPNQLVFIKAMSFGVYRSSVGRNICSREIVIILLNSS